MDSNPLPSYEIFERVSSASCRAGGTWCVGGSGCDTESLDGGCLTLRIHELAMKVLNLLLVGLQHSFFGFDGRSSSTRAVVSFWIECI
jgi:hypothetical protein